MPYQDSVVRIDHEETLVLGMKEGKQKEASILRKKEAIVSKSGWGRGAPDVLIFLMFVHLPFLFEKR